jgi:hypothetical protein
MFANRRGPSAKRKRIGDFLRVVGMELGVNSKVSSDMTETDLRSAEW